MMLHIKISFTVMLTLALLSCHPSPTSDMEASLHYCKEQVARTLVELRNQENGIDYTMMPRNIADSANTWHVRKATKEEWCAGFWPGILWYTYEYTGDENIRQEAERFTTSLEFLSRTPAFDHDLGFLVFCSYGNGYRLTGNPAYKQVILDTADTLATLFNPTVGALLSWPRHVKDYGGHNVIMDNMMNLEMLFWAAKNGGSKHLYNIAVAHADKTKAHHFRPDQTSYHVAVYDTLTGKRINALTHQGYSDESVWTRGQAWAVYGFTVAYRETGDTRYLNFAEQVTDAYLTRLPKDGIPYWDFDDPNIPDAPRDASAACVVASALSELHTYLPKKKRDYYKNMALKMLQSLSMPQYRAGKSKPAFLLHSTGNLPAGSEIDASIIYADYYYIEALIRWQKILNQQNNN